jgi:adenylate cyclase, class 2
MAIEIEKKYRLTAEERGRLALRLAETGAARVGVEFEENIIYTGGNLVPGKSVLRLRRVNDKALLTYKERYPSASAVKRQLEEETLVEDAETMATILSALGFVPACVYEKRRETWKLTGAVLMLDELPFGQFAEIEGEETAILEAERQLGLDTAEAVIETYPQLTQKYGTRKGGSIEARFEKDE